MTEATAVTEKKLIQQHIEDFNFLKNKMFPAVVSSDLTQDQVLFQAGESRSHILWNAGHLVWALDRLLAPHLHGTSFLPDSYDENFKIGSQPTTDTGYYPTFEEIRSNFVRAVESVIRQLSSMSDEDLDSPLSGDTPAKELFPTVGKMVAGAKGHVGYHLGQIALLRRIQGLPSGLDR